MNLITLQNALRSRYLIAITAGVLWAAAFPIPSIAGLGWVAPGLLLMSGLGASGHQRLKLGFAAGLIRSLAVFYWLLLIPFPAGAFLGWVALSAYLALYPAVWVWLCWRIFPGGPESPGMGSGIARGIREVSRATLLQRQIWALSCAAIWVALEMVLGRFLSGFPWNFLGVSQYQILPLAQIASVTGVYGISFLMVWFSVALGMGAIWMMERAGELRLFWADLVLPLVTVAGVAWFGMQQLDHQHEPVRELKVALVQPSIPQTLIWDPTENTNRFKQLLELSERAMREQPDLVIWPEAAVPNLLRYELKTYRSITNLVRQHGAWMILGADDAVMREGTREPQFDFYNSSFLISPDGELTAEYRKRRLVIFGEYMPFVRWLPFLKDLLPIGEGFKAGDRAIAFPMPELGATANVLICFEDTFPHLAREYVTSETDFLVNLTNNGWFGESAAQWQHAANAVFRAIENGVPLVRSTNNGLSCWVDPFGRMHNIYFDGTRDIYQAGYKIIRLPIFDGPIHSTIYRERGDWFGWVCVGFSGLLLGMAVVHRRSGAPKRVGQTAEVT